MSTSLPTVLTPPPSIAISSQSLDAIQKSIGVEDKKLERERTEMSGIERTIVSVALALISMSILVILFYVKPQAQSELVI